MAGANRRILRLRCESLQGSAVIARRPSRPRPSWVSSAHTHSAENGALLAETSAHHGCKSRWARRPGGSCSGRRGTATNGLCGAAAACVQPAEQESTFGLRIGRPHTWIVDRAAAPRPEEPCSRADPPFDADRYRTISAAPHLRAARPLWFESGRRSGVSDLGGGGRLAAEASAGSASRSPLARTRKSPTP